MFYETNNAYKSMLHSLENVFKTTLFSVVQKYMPMQ